MHGRVKDKAEGMGDESSACLRHGPLGYESRQEAVDTLGSVRQLEQLFVTHHVQIIY